MAIAEAKRGHDSRRKKTAVTILPRLIFISPPHNAAHSLHTQRASRVNECYSVIYDTISFQRGKNRTKRWKMPYPSDHLCTSQRGHPPLQDFFTLSLSACLLCNEPESFYTPPVFAYLWCEAPSWIPHSPLADSQPLFVFVAPVRKWPCENSRWQTDETWTLIDSERAINGTYCMPWNQLVAGCRQQVIKSLLNFYLVLLPLPETFNSQI